MMVAEYGGMGGMNQGMQAASWSRKGQRTRFSLRAFRWDAALRPIVDFDIQNCKRINLHCFKLPHV